MIAVDNAGNSYVAGYTSAYDFPTTTGAFQAGFAPPQSSALHVFALKLNSSGSALTYSTYLRGSYFDVANGIALDASGNAYIAGNTNSTDFPTTTGAFKPLTTSSNTGFVTKLNATGTALVYSTFLGGSGSGSSSDVVKGIAIDGAGNAYLTAPRRRVIFRRWRGAFKRTVH